ncbi:hypothetical protein TNCV_595061 [Trichonephila clavipes]|nr:hypothetical protein TNCV_595061 [Trichonephila clavipes]
MERVVEDQISSSINHIKNLTLLTSSKYKELKRQVTVSEWTNTVPLKKSLNAQPIGTKRKRRPNLIWIDGLEKDLLVLRTKNWKTLARRRLTYRKGFLRNPRSTLGCRVTKKEGRKENPSYLYGNI